MKKLYDGVQRFCTAHPRFGIPNLMRVIVIGVEIGFSRSLTAEGFTVTNLLKVVKTAGNAAISVAVESVEVDGGSAVHAGIDLAADKDGIAVSVHDTGSGRGVGIHEVAKSEAKRS